MIVYDSYKHNLKNSELPIECFENRMGWNLLNSITPAVIYMLRVKYIMYDTRIMVYICDLCNAVSFIMINMIKKKYSVKNNFRKTLIPCWNVKVIFKIMYYCVNLKWY